MEIRVCLALLLLATPQWSQAAAKKYSTQQTTYVKASPLAEQQARPQPVYQPAPAAKTYQPQVVAESQPYYAPAPAATTTTSPGAAEQTSETWHLYFALVGGYIDQFETANVTGNGAGGVSLGVQLASGLTFDGTFLYANHTSNHAYCRANNGSCGSKGTFDQVQDNNVDQFYSSLGAKYYFATGVFIEPSIGVVMAYNYREHEPMNTANRRRTQAVDAGATLGADLVLSKWVRIGLDWRYMTNLAYEQDGQSLAASMGLREVSTKSGTNLVDYEGTDYQVWMASAKFLF